MSTPFLNSIQITSYFVTNAMPHLTNEAVRCYLVIVNESMKFGGLDSFIDVGTISKISRLTPQQVLTACEELESYTIFNRKEIEEDDDTLIIYFGINFDAEVPAEWDDLGGDL